MAFVTTPDAVVPAYRPIQWTANESFTSPITKAKVTVNIDGVDVAEYWESPTNADISVSSDFTIDVQEICQNYTAPNAGGVNGVSDIFNGVLGSAFSALTPDGDNELYIEVEYFYLLSGVQTTTGSTDTSATIAVFNASPSHEKGTSLDDYNPNEVAQAQFLTNAPDNLEVCFSASHYLTYINDQIDQFKVISYDSAGNVLESDFFTVGFSSVKVQQATVGVAPDNINDVSSWFASGVTIDSTVSYYTIGGGVDDGGVFGYMTEIRTFRPVKCCEERSVTFHWMNRLGGHDAFTFKGKKKIGDNPVSASYEKPLETPLSFTDFGFSKIDSQDNDVVELVSHSLNQDVVEWLRELQTSVEVYIEATDFKTGNPNYLRIQVVDQSNVFYDPDAKVYTRKLKYQLANSDIIQRP